jgi:hypothetical protein
MAQGSHATWAGVPPERRHCDTCDRTLSITKDTMRIGWPGGQLEVICRDCLPIDHRRRTATQVTFRAQSAGDQTLCSHSGDPDAR